jgi:hypothetical protein
MNVARFIFAAVKHVCCFIAVVCVLLISAVVLRE